MELSNPPLHFFLGCSNSFMIIDSNFKIEPFFSHILDQTFDEYIPIDDLIEKMPQNM
jgi:hypothetical protein